MLAALAVTIGSDTGAAHVLGLPERDVRTARKSVNREEALDLATNALEFAAEAAEAAESAAAPAPAPASQDSREAREARETREPREIPQPPVFPEPRETRRAPEVSEVPQAPEPRETRETHETREMREPRVVPEQVAPPPHVQVAAPTAVSHAVAWTAPMDHLLVQGWHEGVNPSVLATQLGCDLSALALRVQELSYAESAPAQAAAASAQADVRTGGDSWEPAQAPSRQPGRHRRHRADGSPHGLFPQETLSHHPGHAPHATHASHAPQGPPADYYFPYVSASAQ
ncbi:hypothetical protein [Streptomyces venezuelae]|uniref:hypothetical protein n=1 Tax=Streptomyces venezuelae TaxID=54571 RepID=UPI00366A50AE